MMSEPIVVPPKRKYRPAPGKFPGSQGGHRTQPGDHLGHQKKRKKLGDVAKKKLPIQRKKVRMIGPTGKGRMVYADEDEN